MMGATPTIQNVNFNCPIGNISTISGSTFHVYGYNGTTTPPHDKNNTNNTNNSIITKVQQHVPKAFMCGCFYWPIANAINFTFVPTAARVPYLATVGGIWNGYLSYMNAKES